MVRRSRDFVAGRVRVSPGLKGKVLAVEEGMDSLKHSLGRRLPPVIRPRPYKVMVAITAQCNARCIGCRYGRDFMPGEQLDLDMALQLFDDAHETGYRSIRLYGGEPLVHPDLPAMVAHCADIGLQPYVTTNAVLLANKADELVDAGLRDMSVGFYGVGTEYDRYVQIPGLFAKVEAGLDYLAEHHGSAVDLQLNWLLMRPRLGLESWRAALAFAQARGFGMRVDLVHYSLPYFQEGQDRQIQFTREDRPGIEKVAAEILAAKRAEPERIHHPVEGIRSIPDWLIKGPDMRVPCTAYDMIWVGADGTVQMCYVTFLLGNIHETRFRDLVGTPEHKSAARRGFSLDCPNCHCSSNERIMRHRPARKEYGESAAWETS